MFLPFPEDKSIFGSLDRSQRHVSFLPQPRYHGGLPTSGLPTSGMRESTPVHPGPAAHRAHTQNVYTNREPLQNNKLAIKNFSNAINSAQNNRNIYSKQLNLSHSESWRDPYFTNTMPLRMRHDSGSSFRSNEDDGGSTTTSGSYTLDQTDIDVSDMCNRPSDLFVWPGIKPQTNTLWYLWTKSVPNNATALWSETLQHCSIYLTCIWIFIKLFR